MTSAERPASRVLLAEANLVQQCLLGELLQEYGHQVLLADSAPEALKLAGQQAPALVLWDVSLPGLAAAQAAASLRQLPGLANVPVVAMSSGPRQQDRPVWLRAGLDDHLAKPVDPSELQALLLQWLAPRSATSPPASAATHWPVGLDAEVGLRFVGGNAALYRQSLMTFSAMYAAGLQTPIEEPAALRRETHAIGGAAAVLGASAVLAQVQALHRSLQHAAPLAEQVAARAALQQLLLALCCAIESWGKSSD